MGPTHGQPTGGMVAPPMGGHTPPPAGPVMGMNTAAPPVMGMNTAAPPVMGMNTAAPPVMTLMPTGPMMTPMPNGPPMTSMPTGPMMTTMPTPAPGTMPTSTVTTAAQKKELLQRAKELQVQLAQMQQNIEAAL